MGRPSLHDATFGELTWHDGFGGYQGEAELAPGPRVRLLFLDGCWAGADLERARERFQQLPGALPELRRATAAQMLGLYNRVWRKLGPLDEEGFAQHLTLKSVKFGAEARTRLYFKDGGLFAGHSLEVFLDEAGRVRDAMLAG
jgi:hypothetical protein